MSLDRVKGKATPSTVNKAIDELNNRGYTPPTFTVAQLAALTSAEYDGKIVRCSNGNAGAACLAVRQGGAWLRIVFGAAVAAS